MPNSSKPVIYKFLSLILFFGFAVNPVFSFGNQEMKDQRSRSITNSSAAQCTGSQYNQAPELPSGEQPKGVAAADLDGDGLPEVLASFQYTSEGFSVLRNLGGNR